MAEKETKHEEKEAPKVEDKPKESAVKPAEPKKPEVKEKKPEKQIPKKTEAIANGISMPLSKRHCMYICKFIKNKRIDEAISSLQEVIKLKKPIPFKGEIPHRKGKNMMSGRYPIKASKYFINLLKGLRGNVLVNGMDLEKTRIISGSANWASRPSRRGGISAKRAHVLLKAMEVNEE